MIIQVIAAFFATLFFSILFNISKNQLLYCGINGAIGWLVYLLTINMDSIVFSTFLGALTISIIAHILSKIRKAPVTIYLIAGIIPLVPGAILYKAIYNIVIQDYGMSTYYGIQAIELACAIAVAVFLVASVTKSPRMKK
ncbi:threonine/serine exporter family protein [Vallitalea sp.]|jgi:uncharacterized membrane protein YjjB (DUF3815 family)|uniref:threonine/serine exporter family protein n=1 Tax=Vallitalea sp. TaxID=1882829 RepID=UPI0025F6D48E|nr:threonine/serine exporter family protein [Vallitalea sp.]MCT4688104.1 threonine/serine exporter family protein [Vallitalea sp.]